MDYVLYSNKLIAHIIQLLFRYRNVPSDTNSVSQTNYKVQCSLIIFLDLCGCHSVNDAVIPRVHTHHAIDGEQRQQEEKHNKPQTQVKYDRVVSSVGDSEVGRSKVSC